MTRIKKIAAAKPNRIFLREKDLNPDDYKKLAEQVIEICNKYDVPCSLYRYYKEFREFHFSSAVLGDIQMGIVEKPSFMGTSVHSVKTALLAERMGIDYVIAGHIFETQCKPDLAPRGLDFLKSVCGSVKIPVYAIGGIKPENIDLVRNAGASGACIMSGLMTCKNPEEYMKELRNAVIE